MQPFALARESKNLALVVCKMAQSIFLKKIVAVNTIPTAAFPALFERSFKRNQPLRIIGGALAIKNHYIFNTPQRLIMGKRETSDLIF